MMGINIVHIGLFLLVVILVFGTSKLKNVGKDLGGAIKGFKEAMREGEQEKPQAPPQQLTQQPSQQAPVEQHKKDNV